MNRSHLFLEALEDRIAPASLGGTLLGTKSFTYTEADGDHVTVKFSKKIFNTANAGTLDGVFSKDDTTGGLFIDLTQLAESDVANGTDITISVKQFQGGGDGLADVSEIDANGILGNVKIAGNLGSLYINNNNGAALALKSLTVNPWLMPRIV